MPSPSASTSMSDWLGQSDEGQLSIDVFREADQLVVRSLVAGVAPDQIDISIHGDLLTIRGKRATQTDQSVNDWYYHECYWGSFSRSIVLPHEVAADSAVASLKNGVLEIRLTIHEHGKKVKVRWEE